MKSKKKEPICNLRTRGKTLNKLQLRKHETFFFFKNLSKRKGFQTKCYIHIGMYTVSIYMLYVFILDSLFLKTSWRNLIDVNFDELRVQKYAFYTELT